MDKTSRDGLAVIVAALLLGLLARYFHLTPFQALLFGLGMTIVVMILAVLHEIAKWLRELTYEVCKLHDHMDGVTAECGRPADFSTFHFRNLRQRLGELRYPREIKPTKRELKEASEKLREQQALLANLSKAPTPHSAQVQAAIANLQRK